MPPSLNPQPPRLGIEEPIVAQLKVDGGPSLQLPAGPDARLGRGGSKLPIVNAAAQSPALVRQQHADRLAVAVFQLDPCRVRLPNSDVSHQGGRPDVAGLLPEATDKLVEHVRAGRPLA